MEIELMNMCMIYNRDTNEVLVLDKKIKHGWEGLTFPGGHIEGEESFHDSVLREIKEESNLNIVNPQLVGVIQWIEQAEKRRSIGLLYKTESFSGQIIEENEEGRLFWMDWEEFKRAEGLSKSMDRCIEIYEGHHREALLYFEKGQYLKKEFF